MVEMTEWSRADARAVLRRPTATDDKYSRGVLGVRTGSQRYPGAAVLGVEAAWRTGLGMVRYLGDERPTSLILQRRPETVSADGRVQAWLIGSGTDAADRSDVETQTLRDILAGAVPVVVDAGALDLAVGAAAPRILTPHDREHARLREGLGLDALPEGADERARAASALQTARALEAVVLLKGASTIVATPGGRVRLVHTGTPWLATAGTGDVLGGTIGAVLAGAHLDEERGGDLEQLGAVAATGAWLHGCAARRAALTAADRSPGDVAFARNVTGCGDEVFGGPITALDVADALASVVAWTLAAD
ncbi:NAD(P)H-hydrate dehydratase [Microbacterium sp. P02]|uniref:ADP-dependent NAD(P)H-hydrate dehydratase n=1 Tax=Microbacterium sp. P02 TaxID=3366260 RepID=UPI00366B13F5